MSAPIDAVIVGGGPAGCAAALGLARAGARVVVLEQGTYPHDKLCGEFLSPEVPAILSRLGASAALVAPVPVTRVRVTSPGGRSWSAPLEPGALGLSRRVFDAQLAQAARAAGVEVWEGARAEEILVQAPGQQIAGRRQSGQPFRLDARFVLAAHGKRSTFDRALGRPPRRADFIALKAHFRGPPRDGAVELHGVAGGYCGLVDVEGGLVNVCMLLAGAAFRAAGADPDCVVPWLRRQNPVLDAWFAQAVQIDPRWLSIAQVSFGPKSAVEQGVWQLGDAAGLISPLAGDGTAMALRAGELAAAHALQALGGSVTRREAEARYVLDWRREFRGRLVWGRWLQALMLWPPGLEWGLRLFAQAPALGRQAIARTRGHARTG